MARTSIARIYFPAVSLLTLAALSLSVLDFADAAELKGKVISVAAQQVRLAIEGDYLPQVGDQATISFQIPGGPTVRVGTWKVSELGADFVTATLVEATGTPAVDQIAIIDSAKPSRRFPGGDAPSGSSPPVTGWRDPTPSPPQFYGSHSPQGSVHAKGSLEDITMKPAAESWPDRQARAEYVGLNFVVTAPASNSLYSPISSRAVSNFSALASLRVEGGKGKEAVSGFLVSTAPIASVDFASGNLFFGRIEQRIVVSRFDDGTWREMSAVSQPPRPGEFEAFEILRDGGEYVFRMNQSEILRWKASDPRLDFVYLFTGHGSRAEYAEYSVRGR